MPAMPETSPKSWRAEPANASSPPPCSKETISRLSGRQQPLLRLLNIAIFIGRIMSYVPPASLHLTISGDATGTGTLSTINIIHASTGVTAGTYKSVTVDVKGRVTAATNPATLTALQNAAGTGLFAVTASGTGALRTLTGSARITISNPDGVAGNPTLDLTTTGVSAGTFNTLTVDTFG